MSFLATWKNHEQNRVFKLINKILLFQYSEGIFLDHDRPVTFTLAHNTQLITLFLTIAHYPNYRHSHKEVGIDGGELLD